MPRDAFWVRKDAVSEDKGGDAQYLFGHSEEETRRLLLQGRLFNPYTRRLLEDAGITSGMKVLDVGSGAGDVALLAAELVGPTTWHRGRGG